MSKIQDWPLLERPRERLLAQGATHLSNAELLAILLRTGCRGKSAVDVARELLTTLGGLRGVLDCTLDDFCKHQGLGKTKYAQFSAVTELSRRYLQEQLDQQDIFHNASDTVRYLTAKLRHLEYEAFVCLFLDNRNGLIAYEEISRGTHNRSTIYPREIAKRALAHNAAALIFAHNHPSGHAKPSVDDQILTQELQKLFRGLDIKIYDHYIIGSNQHFSFAEQGLLLS